MAKYLFIESRDPFESRDSQQLPDLLQQLADHGDEVALFFIQNGVLSLRKETEFSDLIQKLLENKIKIFADGFSLRERAIQNILSDVKTVEIGELVSLMFEPETKVVWH